MEIQKNWATDTSYEGPHRHECGTYILLIEVVGCQGHTQCSLFVLSHECVCVCMCVCRDRGCLERKKQRY